MSTNSNIMKNEIGDVAEKATTIEIVSLTKRFGEMEVLSNVTLSITDGEFVVLLGPSGCGKSTILRIISGLEDASEGEIYINGELANYIPPKERDVAMVFQNYALYPHMTVERNIGFPLEMRGVPKSERHNEVVSVARLLEIEDQLAKFPEQLSGGQRQRVALGRALVRDPVAFLLDEPLSNLDALLRVQMRDELLNLHRRIGRTTIYVTHDQIEAMTMADRIVVLRHGTVQQIGQPLDIYMRPANTFVATFVGNPQMNLFEGTIIASDDGFCFDGPFSVPLDKRLNSLSEGQAVSLGIRSEDVSIAAEDGPDTVTGQVSLVEPVGSDTYLNVNLTDDVFFKVRVSATSSYREGERVRLKVAPENIHLFDAEGWRLSSEE